MFYLFTLLPYLSKLGQQKQNCPWFQEILRYLSMTPTDYKWVNSHSKVQPCTLTSISLNPLPSSEEVVVPGPSHILVFCVFFCLERSTPIHPRLRDQLIQIHHSCLSYNIISSENPPLPPSCELSYR